MIGIATIDDFDSIDVKFDLCDECVGELLKWLNIELNDEEIEQ